MLVRLSIIGLLLGATLAAPFLLRPDGEKRVTGLGKTEELVIITPHTESIRAEFEFAFVRHMRKNHGREVSIDWRIPGGTSEISMFLKSEYANAFENYWRRETGMYFGIEARGGFDNREVDPDGEGISSKARRMFLESDVGIGLDLFFGGGGYDFTRQAQNGALVAVDASGKFGPAAIREQHPDWFSDEVIPAEFSGEPFYDGEMRWVGSCLTTFGICCNTDVIDRLGIDDPPINWNDLTDPRYAGQIALADPTKSGSVTKAFEMIIQQQIRKALEAKQGDSRQAEILEAEAVREGWEEGMRMILKISANSRYFTDSAAKIPLDVAGGNAAAGMCIDFYGRTFNEMHQREDGSSRLQFFMPEGGTSLSVDPIGMLRGAPHPELAHHFIKFVLSPAGQKVWNFRPDAPGGPHRKALRRPPVRRDFYTPENRALMTDGDVNPFEIAESFVYVPDWTLPAFQPLRFVIRCSSVDTHPEQKAAWKALIAAGFPPEATALFEEVDSINYDRALGEIRDVLDSKDKIQEVELARKLGAEFRNRYRQVEKLAAQSRNPALSINP